MGFGFTKGDIPPEIGTWTIVYKQKKGHILDETRQNGWRWEEELATEYDLHNCGDELE